MRIFLALLCAVWIFPGLLTAPVHAATPQRAYTVIIDPGHGGVDPGTRHNGIIERHLMLTLAKRLKKELRQRGLRVKMTRTGNATLTVAQRVKLIKKMGGKLLISLHVNAHTSKRIRGLEVWHWRKRGGEASASPVPGARLAFYVHRGIAREMRARGLRWANGGVKSGNFGILRLTRLPAVMVEVGYATNRAEARLMRSKDYQAALCKGIADSIIAYARGAKH